VRDGVERVLGGPPGRAGHRHPQHRRLGPVAVVRPEGRPPHGPLRPVRHGRRRHGPRRGGAGECRPRPLRRAGGHGRGRPGHPGGADRHPPREGPEAGVAVPRPHDDGQRRRRRGVDALRVAGAVRGHRHGLRRQHPRHRVRRPVGGPRRVRRRPGRWVRGGHHRDGGGRVHQHDGAVAVGRLPAVRRRPRRLRDGRGRRGAGARGAGGGAGPGGAHLRRGGGDGQHGGRPPHHRSSPGPSPPSTPTARRRR
jgi:hypothetical protein